MSVYYFVLNGPPKSGKSTLARAAYRHIRVRNIRSEQDSLAAPIKQCWAALLGIPYSSVNKDEKVSYLSDTNREGLISLSENHFKKRYGDAVFGNALVHRWRKADSLDAPTVVVVDDCGFEAEFAPLNRDSSMLVRIIRPGFDFSGDSRGYMVKPSLIMFNDAELSKAESIINDYVDYALAKWGIWKC